MTFLLAYLYVHHLIFLPMVQYMHIKLMNTFGKGLILIPMCGYRLSAGPTEGLSTWWPNDRSSTTTTNVNVNRRK